MMKGTTSSGPLVLLACLMFGAVIGSWSWRRSVFATPAEHAPAGERWDHVKQDYPIVQEPPHVAGLSQELLESVVRANPFSPTRNYIPPPADESGEAGRQVSKPPVPLFVYKGRINLGSKQRAIMEDTTTKKTYFLEVGQEVAGCKVLDITENRVVLSDPNTKKDVEILLMSSKTVREAE